MNCTQCGAPVQAGAKFCTRCGARFAGAPPVHGGTHAAIPSSRVARWFRMLGIIFREAGKRFLQGLPFTIFMILVMGVGMYFINLFLIGWMNDGWRFDTGKRWLAVTLKWLGFYRDTTDAAGKIVPRAFLFGGTGGAITVGVLLFIVPTVLMGFLKQGPIGAIRQFVGVPGALFGAFRDTPRAAFSGVCAGAGTGLVIGALVFGYSSLALAAGLGVFLCTNGGRVVSLLLSSIWGATYAAAKGRPEQNSSALAVGYLSMAGGCLGLVIRQMFSTPSCLVVGTLLLGAALLLVLMPRQSLGPSVPASLVWWAALLTGLCFAPALFADDGGFIESGRPHTLAGFLDWLREGGTVGVRDISLIHAIFTSSLGGAFGGGLRGLSQLPPSVLDQLEPLTRGPQDPRTQPGGGSVPPPSPPQAPPGPPLVDPRTGDPLVVNDGSYPDAKKGQVWYGGRWMDPEEANEIIQKEKEAEADYQRRRQQEQAEADERLKQQREEQRNAPDPAAVEAQKRDDAINRMRGMGDNLINGVDDSNRRDFYRDFLERNSNDPDKMRKALDAVRTQMAADGYNAQADAEFWGGMQTTAEDIRDWSTRTNRILSNFVPGGQTIVAWQGAANSGIEGYDKGGLKGAAGSLIANAADNYTRGFATNLYNNNGDPLAAANDWSKQYNPKDYADRIAQAGEEWKKGNINRAIGGLVDVGLDAKDARDDIGDARGAIGNRFGDGSTPDTPPPSTRKPAEDATPTRTPTSDPTGPTTRADTEGTPPTGDRTPGDNDPASQRPARPADTTPSQTDTPSVPTEGATRPGDGTDSSIPRDEGGTSDGTPPPTQKQPGDDAPPKDQEPTQNKKDDEPAREDETPPSDEAPPKDGDDTPAPPEESRADRLKRQREEAIERLGPDHPQIKEIDKRIREAEGGGPPKVEILKPDAPENLPEFKQGEKVSQQGGSISSEEATRPEFIVKKDGTVQRGADNPVDHIGPKESVVQVNPITGERTVLHGPEVPESHKKGIEERLNRNLDDKIKQETAEHHERQKRIKEAQDALVTDPTDAPSKKAEPETPQESSPPPKEKTPLASEDPASKKTEPPKDEKPPGPETPKGDEASSQKTREQDKQRQQQDEQKREQEKQTGEQAQKTPQQPQQSEDKRGTKGGGDPGGGPPPPGGTPPGGGGDGGGGGSGPVYGPHDLVSKIKNPDGTDSDKIEINRAGFGAEVDRVLGGPDGSDLSAARREVETMRVLVNHPDIKSGAFPEDAKKALGIPDTAKGTSSWADTVATDIDPAKLKEAIDNPDAPRPVPTKVAYGEGKGNDIKKAVDQITTTHTQLTDATKSNPEIVQQRITIQDIDGHMEGDPSFHKIEVGGKLVDLPEGQYPLAGPGYIMVRDSGGNLQTYGPRIDPDTGQKIYSEFAPLTANGKPVDVFVMRPPENAPQLPSP